MDLFDEVVGLTRDLIRLDTTNSLGVYPGNETLVARHLAEYLGEAGIECELVAKPDQDHRANLVARISGTDPDAPSLAFVGHTDVVPVDVRDWTHPPFDGVLDDDGYAVGPRRPGHEGRGRGPRGRPQGAGPVRVPAAR